MHVDKSFTKIQARVRPPPIQAMPAFWEHLFLTPIPYVGDDGDDDVSNYIQLDAIINPWLVQKRRFSAFREGFSVQMLPKCRHCLNGGGGG